MPVGFGFSASDFISAILLVKDLILALDNAAGSSAEYQALFVELKGLENALNLLCNSDLTAWDDAHRLVIEQTVQVCHGIIYAFLSRAAKFDKALRSPASASQQCVATVTAWKAALRKVQWAFLKKDDVIRVRLELSAQTSILNTVLNQAQLRAQASHYDILKKLHIQMGLQQDQLRRIDAQVQQHSQLAEDSRSELQSHTQMLCSLQREMASIKTVVMLVWGLGRLVFDITRSVQNYLRNPVPTQIVLQQVATMEDALGRTAPLHIEWLNSREVFHSSLEARFENHPGWTCVRRMDYLIFDHITGEIVDLSKPWDTVLQPGRKLTMCIVLPRHAWSTPQGSCPRCGPETEICSATRQETKSPRHRHSQRIRHYRCKCGLYFYQMRFDESESAAALATRRHRLSRRTGESGARLHYSSTCYSVGTRIKTDPRKYKLRRSKLKRIKGVKRDLLDLQRVFVFEQEANNDKVQPLPPREIPNIKAVNPREASQDDRVLQLSDEYDDDKSLAEDVLLDLKNSKPETFDSRGQSGLSTFDEAASLIEADEQWDKYSMISCFTAFTSASSLKALYENGRRYHGYCAGLYLQPDDEKAQDNLAIGHCLYRELLGGALHLAPIADQPRKVLDIGTGTGIWAIEFADQFPQCQVEGCDLSPVQPSFVPPNLRFYVDDASYLDPSYRNYDFIHIRGLNGCFQDWGKFYNSVLDAICSGGWIEQVELDLKLFAHQTSLPEEDPVKRLQESLFEASKITGKSLDVCDKVYDDLVRAGFSQVSRHAITCPIGPWAQAKTHKIWGALGDHYWRESLEDLCLALLTRFLRWRVEDVQALLSEVQAQLKDRTRHLCFKVIVVYARKPL